jgi:hypothetical protein
MGHHHVQQREINRVAAHPSKCMLSVRCTDNLVTLRAQQCSEQFAVGFVVIGYKHSSFVASRSSHIASSTVFSAVQERLRASILAFS